MSQPRVRVERGRGAVEFLPVPEPGALLALQQDISVLRREIAGLRHEVEQVRLQVRDLAKLLASQIGVA